MSSVSKAFFHALASSHTLQTFASRHGMQRERGFVRRFVPGSTVADAIAAARRIEAAGMTQTLHYLGERGATMAQADAATRVHISILDEIARSGIGRNVSVKLTQLGLTVDRATCVDNFRRILDLASAQDFFVRIDMEDARYTQLTFDIFETLWQQEYRSTGIAVQSHLRRSVTDVRRMNELGARVRLVKGGYTERRAIAYQTRAQVDAAFLEMMRLLLLHGAYPAIATHDPAMIRETTAFAARHQIPPDRYEFQMLYGIRRDLQAALRARGYRVRVYVPFGREWFPYLMRRLGERPANVGFVLTRLLRGP